MATSRIDVAVRWTQRIVPVKIISGGSSNFLAIYIFTQSNLIDDACMHYLSALARPSNVFCKMIIWAFFLGVFFVFGSGLGDGLDYTMRNNVEFNWTFLITSRVDAHRVQRRTEG